MGFKEAGKWWVSPADYDEAVTRTYAFADRIELLDTTLRDGEQQPNIVFTRTDKMAIAKKLDEVGVQRIEAGTPATSDEDAEAIRAMTDLGLKSKIFCFCRSAQKDMELAKSVGVDGVISEMIGSEHLLKYGKRWDRPRALEASCAGTKAAHELGLFVSFFLADASRADPTYLMEFIQAVHEGGHIDSLVLADTFGTFSPEGAAHTVRALRKRFPFPIEVHFHSDYELGVATTLAGLAAGASVAHVTVNGIGERAGSAALESVALALEALYGQKSGIRLDKLKELSELVVKLSRFPVSDIKPVVGNKIFNWDTGLPSSLWLNTKNEDPLIMLPYHYNLTGQREPVLYLGKKSGKDNLRIWMDAIGEKYSESEERELLDAVKQKSIEVKRDIDEDELRAIVKAYRKA
jgi:isopropylmalate/homocitrate/citramalate synthase